LVHFDFETDKNKYIGTKQKAKKVVCGGINSAILTEEGILFTFGSG